MEMPASLQARPQWKGLPIPFTTLVSAIDGEPNFKVTDQAAWEICVDEKRCALCGDPLPYWVWYIGSEQHIKDEVVFDLAMHEDCARYAALSCPYIALGKAYGDHIKPTKGARISELCPRSALSNEGIPLYLFKARRNSASLIYLPKFDLTMARTGKIVEYHLIDRQKEVLRAST